jgi:hypothetical protein
VAAVYRVCQKHTYADERPSDKQTCICHCPNAWEWVFAAEFIHSGTDAWPEPEQIGWPNSYHKPIKSICMAKPYKDNYVRDARQIQGWTKEK